VTRFLAFVIGAAVGTFGGVTLILFALWKPARVAARPYVEDDDGVLAEDPYVAYLEGRADALRERMGLA
jgi:hypothetical protein